MFDHGIVELTVISVRIQLTSQQHLSQRLTDKTWFLYFSPVSELTMLISSNPLCGHCRSPTKTWWTYRSRRPPTLNNRRPKIKAAGGCIFRPNQMHGMQPFTWIVVISESVLQLELYKCPWNICVYMKCVTFIWMRRSLRWTLLLVANRTWISNT